MNTEQVKEIERELFEMKDDFYIRFKIINEKLIKLRLSILNNE